MGKAPLFLFSQVHSGSGSQLVHLLHKLTDPLLAFLFLQQLFTSHGKRRNIFINSCPYGRKINGTISMDIEISGVFDYPPRNRNGAGLEFIGQKTAELPNLHYAHTAGVLKHCVRFKSSVAVIIAGKILGNPLAIVNDLFQNRSITGFDKAAPRLSLSFAGSFYLRIP